jgi:hypothetical protein
MSDSGALLSVTCEPAYADCFWAITFTFDNGTLAIRCNDDTDEIILSTSTDAEAEQAVDDHVLDELIGMRIEYAWELYNHRGYFDAVQFRFIDPDRRPHTCQFEVAASAMSICRVTGRLNG